jgi:hypothetical protein
MKVDAAIKRERGLYTAESPHKGKTRNRGLLDTALLRLRGGDSFDVRLAADEDFNNDIVRALRRTLPNVDVLTVRELASADAPTQKFSRGQRRKIAFFGCL